MRILLALAPALPLALLAAAGAEAKTIRIEVDGLVCAFCAQGIEKKLKAQPATDRVFVSLEKKVTLVGLKAGQDIADETLKAQVTDAGYQVRAITRSDESFDAARAKVKAAR